jgi:hypothetical protein
MTRRSRPLKIDSCLRVASFFKTNEWLLFALQHSNSYTVIIAFSHDGKGMGRDETVKIRCQEDRPETSKACKGCTVILRCIATVVSREF